MSDPNIEMLRRGALKIGNVVDEVVFVGGCIVGLLISDPGAAEVRATDDVDVVVEVISYGQYQGIADKLKQNGFTEDTREGAPLCRFVCTDTILDLMPTDASILGFANPWYELALKTATKFDIGIGRAINVINAPCFAATKIVAFRDRGKSDFLSSHDLEDLITLIDGRPEFLGEFDAAELSLRNFIANEFHDFLANPRFLDSIPGHLGNDYASQARLPELLATMKKIAAR